MFTPLYPPPLPCSSPELEGGSLLPLIFERLLVPLSPRSAFLFIGLGSSDRHAHPVHPPPTPLFLPLLLLPPLPSIQAYWYKGGEGTCCQVVYSK